MGRGDRLGGDTPDRPNPHDKTNKCILYTMQTHTDTQAHRNTQDRGAGVGGP